MLPEFADPKKQISAAFKLHPMPNEARTKKEGRPIFDDIEVCVIRFAGNTKMQGVFPAHEAFTRAPNPETGYVEEVTYAMHFNAQYLQFKNGDAQSMSGTPLTMLPLVTPGKRLELKALAIHTVETLAGIDGAQLKTLGMGGRDLKNQAIAYLEQASKLTDATAVHDELEALRAEVAELRAGKSEPAKTDAANPFTDWESEDLVNWIQTADSNFKIDARWGKAKLQSVAAELNSKLKAAA